MRMVKSLTSRCSHAAPMWVKMPFRPSFALPGYGGQPSPPLRYSEGWRRGAESS